LTEEFNGALVRPARILALHKLGFKLVPISSDGKTPGISWGPIYENGWSEAALSQKYSDFENIASCFGKSHIRDQEGQDLFLNCVDIDAEKPADLLRNYEDPKTGLRYSLLDELAKRTFSVKTRKPYGRHFWFLSHKKNKPIKASDCKPGFEFEIKTDRSSGLCALPPSRHREDANFRYREIGIDNILINDKLYDELVDALKDCLLPKRNRMKENSKDTELEDSPIFLSEEDIGFMYNLLTSIYQKGHRNEICLYLSGFLRKENVELESAKTLISRLVEDDQEKRQRITTLEASYKKPLTMLAGFQSLSRTITSMVGEKSAESIVGSLYQRILAHRPFEEKRDLAFYVSQTLKNEFTYKTMNDTRAVWYYESGVFHARGERHIELECAKLIPTIKTAMVNEVIEMIKRSTPADRFDFDADPFIINVRNGLLSFKVVEKGIELEFRPHTETYLSLIQIPVNYDPHARCPLIIRFLKDVLEPTKVFVAVEILGYCMFRNVGYDKLVLLLGSGGNGKGTFLHLLEALVGESNASHESLQDLAKDRFSKAHLFGKLVNTNYDLDNSELRKVGIIKQLTSGDPISAQNKYEPAFSFRNFAKLLFSLNEPPEIHDKTYAWYRRLIILAFDRTYPQNPSFLSTLTTGRELSGLLNLALYSLGRLLKEGFPEESVERIRQQYEYRASNVKRFIDDRCIVNFVSSDYYTETKVLYDEYETYCKEKGIRPEPDITFGSKLVELGIIKDRLQRKGKRAYFYIGVKLRSEMRGSNSTLDNHS
jgi:P4 family phage/plasmid primase-like protien